MPGQPMISKLFDMGSDAKAILSAIGKSLAIIEFDPDGKILAANKSFCDAVGYDFNEIAGRHHSMFVETHYAQSHEYKEFWAKLGRGEFNAQEFKRIGKGGREIWFEASYNPILNAQGKLQKVVKIATDITAKKLEAVVSASKLAGISRFRAVIEFTVDGTILTANDNFLQLLGYRLDEIVGRHHSMFVEASFAQSGDYREFWAKLGRGEFVAQDFKRIGKGGKEVWIQANYNPIFDLDGKVIRVVKFATDVTERVQAVSVIGEALEYLARGELYFKIEKPIMPALEKLRTDFNEARSNLKKAMWDIGGTAMGIQKSTTEIQASADELSKRTEQQAASLEETAAALDQITATVRTTAAGAKQACEVVGDTKVGAEHSGEVVRKAVEAMTNIEKSSGQIGQIIGVIDEIAFQTNLLALNAGVEAARAGDAGRGFAVVASEVRALAQRSAEAAKEIKSLILASRSQVEEGVDLVGQTGKALTRIVEQVSEINGIVIHIASSAQEQSTALAQVNASINQMDQMTQKNAAMAEESTAATHVLADQTAELFRLMAGFRVAADNGMAKQSSTPQSNKRPAAPSKPVAAMKVVGRGGAAQKPKADQDWEEF
jgi:methyl-accepting chemotaxis protein